MFNFLIPLFGGLSNCYLRGGGLESFTGKNHWWGKPLFLVYTTLVLYLTQGLSWTILTGTVAMQIGMMFGWGAYIGAVFKATKPSEEVKFIDWIIQSFKDKPRLWGVLGLTLRGLLWSSCLAIGTLNPWFIPLGLTMGISYLIPSLIVEKFNLTLDRWRTGEIIFGTVLFIGFLI